MAYPFRTLLVGLCIFGLALSNPAQANNIRSSHALSLHGQPALPAHFKHFPYANPHAPKGGRMRLNAIGTFDSLNPFINRGVAAAGISNIYDSLTTASKDEPFSRYGLLAKRMEYDPNDASWIIYHLRPEARFHDGHPVRAEDVVFTFDLIKREGSPGYKAYFADVAQVEALSPLAVKFSFRSQDNRELPLIVGEMSILPKHFWQDREFNQTSLTPPLGSGPYRVSHVDQGKRISYKRNPDYWGRDLPVNKGHHNVDEIAYVYYRDGTVAFEGFKAGQYDVRFENKAKTWATEYNFPAVRNGKVALIEQRHSNPSGMQGFIYNMRRPHLQNRDVRQAIALAFDFEWSNRALFYSAYERTHSYFENSELAADGLPDRAELRLLNRWKDQLPEAVFGSAVMAPESQGDGYNRAALIRAQRMLKAAGWSYRQGALRNAAGEPLRLEMMLVQPEFERIVHPFRRNLARLGIRLDIRILDAAQYIQRLRQFDFDLTVTGFPASSSPGNELWNFWSSQAADTSGSGNLAGLKSPAVDSLISGITQARTRNDLVTHVRALDRILRAEWLVVPHYHTPVYRIASWQRFGRPERPPLYGDGIDTWWALSATSTAE